LRYTGSLCCGNNRSQSDQYPGQCTQGIQQGLSAEPVSEIQGSAAGRAWIKDIAEEVKDSCSANVIQFNNEFSRLRRHGIRRPEDLISAVWVHLALSWKGMEALGLKKADLDAFPE
jgi:hypothetical protein